ncbi:MAG: PIN domain-containing protein [Phycisphaeraceae bacterium]|nr:PIN domain-containing protein [Phycisphaeraceae bacterium]
MAFTVVLDTCVLYPAHLRDTLLRLAERGLYRAQWSDDILTELERNLTESGVAPPSVSHLVEQMQRAFPDAKVLGYLALIPTMTCDEKDRHVLAAAVRADAAAIITFNGRDFPDESVDPFQVDVIDPDAFLLDQLDLSPRAVLEELELQAAANRREPKSVAALLDALARAGVPQFADEVRRRRL